MMTADKRTDTGEFYRGPNSAMQAVRPGNTLPIAVVRDETFEEEVEGTTSPPKENTGPILHMEYLTLSTNLKVEHRLLPTGEIEKKISAHPFWRYLAITTTALLLFTFLVAVYRDRKASKKLEKQSIALKKQQVEQEKKEEDLAEKLLTPIKQETVEPSKIVKRLPLNAMKVYASAEEIIPKIKKSEEESLKILREGIRLQNEASFADDSKEKMNLLRQSIHRLRAILMNSKVSDYNRRLATYNLWVVYACKMHGAQKSAKRLRKLLNKYNRQAGQGRKFRAICPED